VQRTWGVSILFPCPEEIIQAMSGVGRPVLSCRQSPLHILPQELDLSSANANVARAR